MKVVFPKGKRDIIDKDGKHVCFANTTAYRDDIVKVINSHEKLVNACIKALSLISEDLEYAGEPVRENNYKFLEQALNESGKQ